MAPWSFAAVVVVCLAFLSAAVPAADDVSGLVDRPVASGFEANVGQFAAGPEFVLRAGRVRVLLERSRIVLDPVGASQAAGAPLAIAFEGAGAGSTLDGIERLSGTVRYLAGSDPARWLADVPAYAAVVRRGASPGIDVVHRGDGRRLDLEFVISPGADPSALAISFGAAGSVTLDASGDAVVQAAWGPVRLARPAGTNPRVQDPAGQPVVGWRLAGGTLALAIENRAPSGVLRVRTSIDLAGARAGEDADPVVPRVALDGSGGLWLSGTVAADAPGTRAVVARPARKRGAGASAEAPLTPLADLAEAYVMRFDAAGVTVEETIFFGGSGEDVPRALAVLPAGELAVAGSTTSRDFPGGAPGRTGRRDAFVLRVGPDRAPHALVFGGAGDDAARAVAADPAGRLWIAGRTASADFPSVGGLALPRLPGGTDAFLVRMDAAGTLDRAAALGGSGDDEAGAVAVDAGGSVIVAGTTGSADWPAAGGGGRDVFLLRLDPLGLAADLSSRLGGSGDETGTALAVHPSGDLVLAGTTTSRDFPVQRAEQPDPGGDGGEDAFLLRLEAAGAAVRYATYLGGSDVERVGALALDVDGEAWIAGATRSDPVGAAETTRLGPGGEDDAFSARVGSDGRGRARARVLAGTGDDEATAIVVGEDGTAVVAGITGSTALPGARRALPTADGAGEAFLARVAPDEAAPRGTCPGTRNFDGGPGGTGTAWETAANWSGDVLPTATDDVCIDGAYAVVVGSGSQAAGTLRVQGGASLRLNAGTLTIGGASEISGPLTIANGTLTGAGAVTISGLLTWSNGTISGGPGVVTANGGILFDSSSAVLSGRTLVHTSASPGAVIQLGTSASFYLSNGATFTNAAGALFEVQNDQGVFNAGGAASVFNNSGTFRRTNTSGVADIQNVTFNNLSGGAVEVQSGTLQINGTTSANCGSACPGSWKVAAGAFLSFAHSGTYALSGPVGGATPAEGGGSVTFDAGTQTLTGSYEIAGETLVQGSTVSFSAPGPTTISLLRLANGTLGGSSQIDVPSLFTWSTGTLTGGPAPFNANGGILFNSSSAVLNGRAMNHTSASVSATLQTGTSAILYLSNGATFTNAAGALFEIQNENGVFNAGGTTPVFNNAGTFRRTTSSGVADIQGVTFNNVSGGAVEVQSGTLQVNGTTSANCGSTCAGAWKVATGAILSFAHNGTYALSGPFGGPTPAEGGGSVTFDNGTQNLTGSYQIAGETLVQGSTVSFSAAGPTTLSILRMVNGTLGGSSQIDVPGLFTWSGGTVTGGPAAFNAGGGILFNSTSTVLNGRAMSHTSTSVAATLQTGTGAALYLSNGAVFNNAAGALFEVQNDNGVISAGGTTSVFNNSGTFRRTTTSGVADIQSVTFNNLSGGSVEVHSGTLQVNGTTSATCGGTCPGAWKVAAGAILSFAHSGTYALSGPIGGAAPAEGGGSVTFDNGTQNLTGSYQIAGETLVQGSTVSFSAAGPTTVSILRMVNGTLGGSSQIDVPGQFTWSGGTIAGGPAPFNAAGGILLNVGAAILNGRTLNHTSTSAAAVLQTGTNAYLSLSNGATFNNAVGAVFEVQNDNGVFSGGGATCVFNNSGTFRRTTDSGLADIQSVTFNNLSGGAVEVQSGTLQVNGTTSATCGGTCPGAWKVASGALLSFAHSGTYALSGPFGGPAAAEGGGKVTFDAGTQNLTGSYQIAGETLVAGSTVSFSAPAPTTISLLRITSGTLGGSSQIDVPGLFTWSGGMVTGGPAPFNAAGGILFDSSLASLSGRTLNHTSTTVPAAIQAGTNAYLGLGNGAVFNNAAGAVFEVRNDNGVFNSGGATSVFNNSGTFRRTTSSGLADIQSVTFNNLSGGSVEVNSGTLQVNGTTTATCGGTCPGAWKVASGALLSFAHSGTYALSGPIGGATPAEGGGSVTFDTGTQNLTGTYQVAGETLVAGSTVNFSAAAPTTISLLRITSGTLGGSSQIDVPGLFTWSGGTVTGGPAPINAAGGILFDSTLALLSGRPLNHTSTTVPATIQAGTGAYLGLANGATFTNAAGALFEVRNDNGVFNGGGTASVFNNSGTFRRTTASGLADIQSVTFNNLSGGAVEVQSGTLQISGTTSATCGGTCPGAWKVATGARLSFAPSGTYALSGPIGGPTPAEGGGSVSFDSGTQNLTGTYQVAGETLVAGSTVNFSAPAPTTISLLRMTSGTLGGSSAVEVSGLFTWSSGTVTGGPAPFHAAGGILFDSSTLWLDGRTLSHTSASPGATMLGPYANLYLTNGAVFQNAAGAVFEIQNDGGIYAGGGADPLFANAGTFRRSTGSATATLNVPFTNSGTVRILSGILSVGPSYTQTAGSTLLQGGSLHSYYQPLFQGGILGGVGTIQAAGVNSTGGHLAPGLSPGKLTLVGDYVQGSGGSYDVEIGGLTPDTQHDVFAVTDPGGGTGDATLGGTLNVTLVEGFDPAIGDSFTIMTFDTRSGQFASTNLPAFGCGKTWDILYGATSVVLEVVAQPGTADLSVSHADAPDPVAVGDPLTYTVTVSNAGPDPATGVSLQEILPAATVFVSATPGQGTCSHSAGTVTCSLGSIASGASVVTTVVVTPSAPGSLTATASATSQECDPDPADATGIAAGTTVLPACPDADGDGAAVCDASCLPAGGDVCGDCNDGNPAVRPGVAEACDGLDTDCSGGVPADEADADADTFRICQNDCDDGNAAVNPGVVEDDPLCADGIDNDCDTAIDLADPSCLGICPDSDNDGYAACDATCVPEAGDQCGDCNDANAAVKPGAAEIAGDGVDQNCDGAELCFQDADNDGVRPNSTATVPSADLDCADSGEAVASDPTGDCDDGDPAVKPGAAEIPADGSDQNCDGAELCFADADDDGVRPDASSTVASADLDCTDAGEAVAGDPTGDCDDGDAAVRPGATELPADGVDQDCNGGELCFADADDDGYRPDASSTVASADLDCADAGEAVGTDPTGDCNDAAAGVRPGATEVPGDGADQDCDGTEVCFADADNDGLRPDAASTVASTDTDCADPGEAAGTDPVGDCDDSESNCGTDCSDNNGNSIPDCAESCPDADADGYAVCDGLCSLAAGDQCGDCDDTTAARRPGNAETCDGLDNDCAGGIPADEADADADTFLICEGDCDDGNDAVHPGATELAGDGVDQDCDGDELCFKDADDDGYRPDAASTVASADLDCSDTGEATSSDPTGDCDDAAAAVRPGATEQAGDGVDQNCDGAELCFADADDDGYRPDTTSTVPSADLDCSDPGEAVSSDPAGDCDDASGAVKPGATELPADGVDQDCNGHELCFADADNDGFRPDATSTVPSTDLDCDDPGEALGTDPIDDRDDTNPAVYPGAPEIPGDGIDEDGDGTEICFADADHDGYRPDADSTVSSADLDCSDPGEAPATAPLGDCDDGNAGISPGAHETGSGPCNDGVDNDCDDLVDADDLQGCGLTLTNCSTLGDQAAGQEVDQDVWTLTGRAGEIVTVRLDATSGSGRADLILMDDMGSTVDLFRIDRTTLSNEVSATLPADGPYRIAVDEQPASLLLPGTPFRGPYCLTVDADQGAAGTVAPTSSVEGSPSASAR